MTSKRNSELASHPSPFEQYAQLYVERGFWPRRITPGTKACYDKNWQAPVASLPPPIRNPNADYGIGLLMGSPFPDGTTLGALDIDDDSYVALGRALLSNPICGRIGQKGIAYFVRVRGVLGNPEFRVHGAGKNSPKVAECLFREKLCVLPPTIHPNIGQPYQWVGRTLLDVTFDELPVVEG